MNEVIWTLLAFHVQAPAMSQDLFDAGTACCKSYAMRGASPVKKKRSGVFAAVVAVLLLCGDVLRR